MKQWLMTEKLPLDLHELLDRYEILYPENTKLSDLRRAVVDQDLSSLTLRQLQTESARALSTIEALKKINDFNWLKEQFDANI